jgi:hypothetical protein
MANLQAETSRLRHPTNGSLAELIFLYAAFWDYDDLTGTNQGEV